MLLSAAGLFQEAQDALSRYGDHHSSVTAKVLAEQITKRVSDTVSDVIGETN